MRKRMVLFLALAFALVVFAPAGWAATSGSGNIEVTQPASGSTQLAFTGGGLDAFIYTGALILLAGLILTAGAFRRTTKNR